MCLFERNSRPSYLQSCGMRRSGRRTRPVMSKIVRKDCWRSREESSTDFNARINCGQPKERKGKRPHNCKALFSRDGKERTRRKRSGSETGAERKTKRQRAGEAVFLLSEKSLSILLLLLLLSTLRAEESSSRTGRRLLDRKIERGR